MNKIKVIILNAPPHSGKDTIADLLLQHGTGGVKLQFKDALYQDTAELFKIPLPLMVELATDRVFKETKMNYLGDRSPREALIFTSEEVMKPRYGKSHYGMQLREAVLQAKDYGKDFVVVPDGGFEEELQALSRSKEIEVIKCRLYRDSFDFSNDSRNYFKEGADFTLQDGNPMHTVNIMKELYEI